MAWFPKASYKDGRQFCSKCGSYGKWDFDTDCQTGSSILFCKECGTGYIIGRGYIDDAKGVSLSVPTTVGSWCSHKVARGWLRRDDDDRLQEP